MTNIIIGQILGVIATIITFISYQTNTKKALLITQSLATFSICMNFLFLGASTGFALNIICLVRNASLFFIKVKTRTHYIVSAILTLLMIFVGVLSWQGPISLLIIIALATNTVFLCIGNPQLLRKSILVTSSMIIIYNIFVFSLGGITNEGVAIVSSAIGILRYKKKT